MSYLKNIIFANGLKTALLCAGATLVLAGCSSGFVGSRESKPQLVAEPDKTSLMIADAADRASRALESLAAIEQERTPSATAAAAMVPNAPPELRRAVTFSWSGPVEPVTRDIAARAGYTFRTVGDAPPTPILITLDVTNEPMIEVLRSIGLQMGARADLKLDAAARSVDIIYASTVNGPSTGLSASGSAVEVPHRVPPSRRSKKKG